jgi:hypothetical protein
VSTEAPDKPRTDRPRFTPADNRLAQVLDDDRLDAVGELLMLAAKFASAGAIAADNRDPVGVAVRTRQTTQAIRAAAITLGSLGKPEAVP